MAARRNHMSNAGFKASQAYKPRAEYGGMQSTSSPDRSAPTVGQDVQAPEKAVTPGEGKPHPGSTYGGQGHPAPSQTHENDQALQDQWGRYRYGNVKRREVSQDAGYMGPGRK